MVKIFMQTFGCVVNMSDSEVMKGLLEVAGHTFVETDKDAELLIFNSCTVKGPTEFRFFTLLKKTAKKPTIIAGCIPQADKGNPKLKDYSLIGPYNLTHINEAVKETMEGKRVVMLERTKDPRLNIPKIRKSNIIEIIPICAGCLGDPCSYCIVKKARGYLMSYAQDAILKQAKDAIKDGVKEIWLTAQDTGCYGEDINRSLPELLEKLVDLEGDFKIRLGMANPNHIQKFIPRLIEVFKHEKMFKFLHIPIQSGSDRILRSMRRHYTSKEFLEIIEAFRTEIPLMTFSTDIIVGYPGETELDFMGSLNILEKARIDVLNLSRFWSRVGTEAATLKEQIPGEIVKERIKRMLEVFNKGALENNKRFVGAKCEVIVDEKGKSGTKTMIGRNEYYKQVIVANNSKIEIGTEVLVEISKATKYHLISK